jgi:hypothetical protein
MSIETEAIVSRNMVEIPTNLDTKSHKRTSVPLSRLKKQRDGVETLERLKRWPGLRKNVREDRVSIFSGEYGAYWREGGYGFTEGREKWVLTLDEALTQTSSCCPQYQIEFHSVVEKNIQGGKYGL